MNTEEMMIRPVNSGDVVIREFRDGVIKVEFIDGPNILHKSYKSLLDVCKALSDHFMWSPGGKFDQQDNNVEMESWLLSQTPDWNATVPNT